MYVAQQLVVNCRIASVIFRAYRSQSRHSKQRFENILETRNATLEIVDDPRGIPRLSFIPSNIQPLIFSSRAMGGR